MKNQYRQMLRIKLLMLPILFLATALFAQESDTARFTTVYTTASSPVKNQSRSGTCWSFATTSFIESELIRQGAGEYDLSEMYFVYHTYLRKAGMMHRYRGKANIGPGGQAHDVMNTIRASGIMPEQAYSGLASSPFHDHTELDAAVRGLVTGLTASKQAPVLLEPALAAVLDIYLGKPSASFEYQGKKYDPQSFAASLPLDPDDYVELTSYTHHPFYRPFVLEVNDNWSFDSYYNIPLDELIGVMEYALSNGYSICWDGDVSDPGFSHQNALAIAPADETNFSFEVPAPERSVCQFDRQQAFDDFSATDDHLMHITGMVEDQDGTKYYVTKNSWGEDRNENGGYLNMSESYVRLNTVAIMVHRDAIPKDIRKQLGI